MISTQIRTSVLMKLIMTTSSTTTTTPNIGVDLSKLQQQKGISFQEGGSSSSTKKPITNANDKDKGKGIHVETTIKEKKSLQELEME